MIKVVKKCIVIVLLFTLISTLLPINNASAATADPDPTIVSKTASISGVGSNATVKFSMTTKYTTSTTVIVQWESRISSSASWQTFKTNQFDNIKSGSCSWSSIKKGQYRAKVTFIASGKGGRTSTYVYTGTYTY